MFSSFSFGKVIKTILPGFILTAAIFFVVEALMLWYSGDRHSLLAVVADKDRLATVTALLLPFSLLLGFLLNTLVWIGFNPTMRAQVDAELAPTVFADMRQQLTSRMWGSIGTEFNDAEYGARQARSPLRTSLEYYYLPLISLDRLNYLWESYFSWYEFQINTSVALVLLALGECCYFWVAVRPIHPDLAIALVLVLIPMTVLLAVGLWQAAKRNLVEYRKNLLLLIAGSLAHAQKGNQQTSNARPWWQFWA